MGKWLGQHFTPWWFLIPFVCWTVIQGGIALRTWADAPNRVVSVSDTHLTNIEKLADKHLGEIETKADSHLKTIEDKTNARVSSALAIVDSKLDLVIKSANTQIATTRFAAISELHPITLKVTDAVAAYGELPRSVAPTVDYTNKLAPFILDNLHGTISAFKLTAGEMAAASKTFEDTSRSFDTAAKKSAEASGYTATTMKNLATATKPLPSFIRIPLSITGAVAPTVAGAVSTAAATGAFH